MSWQPEDGLENYEPPETCECDDTTYHEACHNKPMDHGNVITSPALCGPCLYGCNE